MATKLAQNIAAVWIGGVTSALILLAGFVVWINDGTVTEIPSFVGLGVASGLGALAGIARGEATPD